MIIIINIIIINIVIVIYFITIIDATTRMMMVMIIRVVVVAVVVVVYCSRTYSRDIVKHYFFGCLFGVLQAHILRFKNLYQLQPYFTKLV